MNKTELKTKSLYGSFVIIQCLLWGVGNTVMKFGLETIPPFYYLAIRFILSSILFFLFFRKQIMAEFKKEYLGTSVIIGLFTSAAYILSTLALVFTTATVTGFLMSLTVIFTPILSFFILKDKADKKLILIISVIVAGMYMLCANSGKFSFGIGELFAILTAVSGSAMLIYTSKHLSNIGPIALSLAQMVVCGVITTVFALLFEDAAQLSNAPVAAWMTILYTAIGCTCIAYLLQNLALTKVSATFVGVAFCSEPIFTAASAYIILGEALTTRGFIGCALILVGLVLAALMGAKKEETLENEEDPGQQQEDPR